MNEPNLLPNRSHALSAISQRASVKAYAWAAIGFTVFAGAGVLMREHPLDAREALESKPS